MVLQLGLDALDVLVGAVVAGLELLNAVGRLFEEAEDTLWLLGGGVKALQFRNQVRDELAGLAHVLGLDAGERGLGEVAQLLLAGSAVLQDHLGVRDVDFLSKVVDHLPLLGGEGRILDLHGGRFFAFRDDFLIGSGVQGQRWSRIQRQRGGGGYVQVQFVVQVSHSDLPFLYPLFTWQGSGFSGYCPAPQYR